MKLRNLKQWNEHLKQAIATGDDDAYAKAWKGVIEGIMELQNCDEKTAGKIMRSKEFDDLMMKTRN